jgi:transcriptional regulator with XRE-family HTH domain
LKYSNRIKYLRNHKNLTQIELANILGISQTAIALYESGKRDLPLYIEKLIDALYGQPPTDHVTDPQAAYQTDFAKLQSENQQMRAEIDRLRRIITDAHRLLGTIDPDHTP